MSSAAIITDKYAKAAFNIAKKNKLGSVFVQDLDTFCQKVSPILQELSNPTISKAQMDNVIKDITKKLKTNSIVSDFLIVLAESKKINLVCIIQKKLEVLVKQDNNILQVELIGSKKLKAAQVSQAKKLIKEKYPKKEIEIQETIQESILGGVIIKIGSVVIDGSVKNQLSSIFADCRSVL